MRGIGVAKTDEEIKIYKDLRLVHQALNHGLERQLYQETIDNAKMINNYDTVCSFVVDSFDHSKCLIPQMGPRVKATYSVPQHMTGILHHVSRDQSKSNGSAGSMLLK